MTATMPGFCGDRLAVDRGWVCPLGRLCALWLAIKTLSMTGAVRVSTSSRGEVKVKLSSDTSLHASFQNSELLDFGYILT